MWKSYIHKGIKYLFILLCIVAFGIAIYPGLYKYDKLDQKYPVMINRITGETKVLYGDAWSTVGNIDAQISKFIEYKEEIESTLDVQSDNIKEEILETIKEELDSAKNQVIADVNTSPTISAEEFLEVDFDAVRNRNYTGEYFGIGDSQETVKNIMGVADTINKVGPYETWFYNSSSIKFENGKVSGWNNINKNLHIK